MFKNSSIIYINFSQYDNSGRILDFLIDNFDIVVHFSYDHLRLKKGRRTNFVKIYKNRRFIRQIKLYSLKTPDLLLFPSLPLVALLMLLQTIFYSILLKKEFGIFEIYFTVNAYTAWIGLIIKKLQIANKTVFWVWDYFPTDFPDWRLKLARKVYWQFDKMCLRFSENISFTNNKLLKIRRKAGLITKKMNVTIVPLGTSVVKSKHRPNKTNIIGFLGMIKSSQGIELIINSAEKIFEKIPYSTIEIIGSGPEEEYYKKTATKHKNKITFFGFITDDKEVQKKMKRWKIGLATYKPTVSNESYWGDPSKIKTYIGIGLPVITTDISYITQEIINFKAGEIIEYTEKDLINAIKKILNNYNRYQKNALRLASKYEYKNLYPTLFKNAI